jgi:hypothetical protein
MQEKNGNDIRHTFSFHSLRKFFTTQMCEVFAVPAQTVELLCARDIGVSQSDMMPSPDQMRKRYASTMQKVILTQAPMEVDIEIAVEEKIQDFKSSTNFQDMIRAEVVKAFDRLHTIEEQIS